MQMEGIKLEWAQSKEYKPPSLSIKKTLITGMCQIWNVIISLVYFIFIYSKQY